MLAIGGEKSNGELLGRADEDRCFGCHYGRPQRHGTPVESFRGESSLEDRLENQDIEATAQKVIELIKPLLSGNSKHYDEDALITVDATAKFLKTRKGQIYQWGE